MVFQSVEEFSKTRFGVQQIPHVQGSVGYQSDALQGKENSRGNFIFDDIEVIFCDDGPDFARY